MLPMRRAPGRSSRVPTPEIEVRLGSVFGRLVNVSASGALIRTNTPFLLGRSCPLFVNLDSPVALTVRIVRAERALQEGLDGEAVTKYFVGVMFSEFSATAKQAVAKLCGAAFARHDETI
jgi:PilZ domain-containing protein